MANETRRHISELLLSNKKHAKYVGILACLAVAVAFGVSMGLRQNGRAATHEEQVLDCHYAGNGAHTHDESCYDKDGNLVCPLPERELHTHTDACYSTEERLICGLEESEGHTHTDACYDEEGNLICGLEESEGHTHTEDCYETIKTLTCDKEEITEEHVHGPGCFKTITVVVADEMPAMKLTGLLKRIDEDDVERTYMVVNVDAPEGAFPEGTTMEVEAVPAKDIQDRVDEALTLSANKELIAKQIQAVDITFMFDGKEIDPAEQIEVKISSAKIDEIEDPLLVHIDEDVTQVGTVKDADVVNADEEDTSTGHENTFKFDTMLSGIYAITEAEPVVSGEAEADNADEAMTSQSEASSDSETASLPEQTFKDTLANITVSVKAPEGAFPEGTTMRLSAVEDGSMDEAIKSTVDGNITQVAAVDITFYDAEGNEIQPKVPINVTMTNADAAEDGEAMVVHINNEGSASVVEQTMLTTSNEEVVFDAEQFSVYAMVIIEKDEDTLKFETDSYVISVSYTKEAEIPYGTDLEVTEITPDQEQYWELRKKTLDKINEGITWDDTEMTPDPRKGIADAVFFDVTLTYEGKEIEPKVPLAVEVSFKGGGITLPKGESAQVIHFGDKKTEVIEDVEVEKKDGEATSFSYEQDSFSPLGVFTTNEYVEITSTNSESAGISSLSTVTTQNAGASSIAAEKTITDVDEDGVYELALRVTGKSESSSQTSVSKSNVVIVVDVSGSMTQNKTYTEYTGAGTTSGTYYGIVNKSYVELTWRKPNNSNRYHWQYKVNNSYTDYDGKVYYQETRLAATKRALKELVGALLSNNEDRVQDGVSLNDIVEITLVKFAFANEDTKNKYNGTSTLIRNVNTTTEHNSLNTTIDNLWAGGGTNWERALKVAKEEADKYKKSQPNEPVSVIFVTDGVPTSWGTNNTVHHQGSSAGQETADNTHDGWDYAKDDVRSIVSAGYTLYDIFAFGTDKKKYNNDNNRTDADYLRSLTNYAYSGSGSYSNTTLSSAAKPYFFNASDTSALQDAFNAIIEHMSGYFGYGGILVDDGVTTGVTSTSITVDGSINTNKFRYAIKSGNTTLAKVHIEGNNATFTIGGNEYTTTGQTETTVIKTDTESTTHTNTVFSVTVGDKTYKMSPASFDNKGKIQWDLAGVGLLPNGYTYELTFDVWPNQFSFDIVADLNNGIKTLEQIEAEVIAAQGQDAWKKIEDALVSLGNGKYAIRTNYEEYVDYYTVDSETNEQTNETTTTYTAQPRKQLGPKDPVNLTSTTMNMLKVWQADLDEQQLDELLWKDYPTNTESTGYKVRLHVWKADTLEALNSQIASYSTNPTDADAHDYIAKDLGWNGSTYDWEDSLEVAPGTMISITTAEEMGVDVSKHTQVTYNNKKYVILESGHYYTVTEDDTDYHFELETIVYHPMLVDGKLSNVTFKEDGTVENIKPMSTVEATNALKSGIIIEKQVEVAEGATLSASEKFTIKVNLKNADNTAFTASADQSGYRILNYSDARPEDEKDYRGNETNPDVPKNTTKNRSGRFNISNGEFTVQIYAGEKILVANVDSGVTYTVDEIDVPAGYQKNITYRVDDVEETTDTHVVKSNTDHAVTIVNKLSAINIRIWKCGDSSGNSLEGAEFALYGSNYGDSNAEPLKTGLISNNNGRFDLGALAGGTYYLVETKAPDGYNKLVDPVKIVVDGNQENEADKVKYYQTGNSQADYSALDGSAAGSSKGKYWDTVNGTSTCRLLVINSSGAALPSTGGMGTMPFTILGTAIVVMAILAYGLQSRRSSGRRSM